MSEPVKQLRPQVAFFRIHRSNQDEACFNLSGKPFALQAVLTACGGIQGLVHQMVGQQIDFVHIQHPTVGLFEEPFMLPPFPLFHEQGGIHGTEQPFLRST